MKKVMCVLCSLLILVSLVFIANEKYPKYKAYKESNELQKLQQDQRNEERKKTLEEKIENAKDQINKIMEDRQKQSNTPKKEILKQYEKRYNENSDFYAWIKIEGTNVDYPVMYTPEYPNFYVYKNFEKQDSQLGSIYINGYSNPEKDGNILLYGHNRADLTMFGSLSYYKEKNFYDAHKNITFNTIYEESTYEIIGVVQAFVKKEDLMDPKDETKSKVPFKELEGEPLFYNYLKLDTKEEFEEYIRYVRKYSYYPINFESEYGDKLLTLCTCTNTKKYQNERLLIVAKKIK